MRTSPRNLCGEPLLVACLSIMWVTAVFLHCGEITEGYVLVLYAPQAFRGPAAAASTLRLVSSSVLAPSPWLPLRPFILCCSPAGAAGHLEPPAWRGPELPPVPTTSFGTSHRHPVNMEFEVLL